MTQRHGHAAWSREAKAWLWTLFLAAGFFLGVVLDLWLFFNFRGVLDWDIAASTCYLPFSFSFRSGLKGRLESGGS